MRQHNVYPFHPIDKKWIGIADKLLSKYEGKLDASDLNGEVSTRTYRSPALLARHMMSDAEGVDVYDLVVNDTSSQPPISSLSTWLGEQSGSGLLTPGQKNTFQARLQAGVVGIEGNDIDSHQFIPALLANKPQEVGVSA